MWRIEGLQAQWSSAALELNLDISQPWTGIRQVRTGSSTLDPCRLFTLRTETPQPLALCDHYVRGNDLIAHYQQSDWSPSVYWSVPREEDGVVGLQMIVSAETELLGVTPRMIIGSQLAGVSVERLVDAAKEQFQPVAASADFLDSERGEPGVFLFRLHHLGISYVQMVHPSDFEHTNTRVVKRGEQVTLEHDFLTEKLEKGVIRRGRLNGILVSSEDDHRLAIQAYNRLLVESPPLTT